MLIRGLRKMEKDVFWGIDGRHAKKTMASISRKKKGKKQERARENS